MALPRLEGAGKPGSSPFLGYTVQLRNWNQHVLDCEEKLRCDVLLSHLVKDAQERIIGSYSRDLEAMQRMASSDTLPAQESNAEGDNYHEEVRDGIGHDG